MPSIRQNDRSDALPDFRNLGVVARILLAVNAAAFAAAALRARGASEIGSQFMDIAWRVEPVLLACLAVLHVAGPLLSRLRYAAAAAAVIAVVTAVSVLMLAVIRMLGRELNWEELAWSAAYGLGIAAILLEYFRLRERALSPALAEARLQALQARIRPHFLFNSLNAVLALVRHDPRRAEGVLEDLAELFRNLLADNRQLIPLRDEIGLCRKYLTVEELRLGERLRVSWSVAPDAEEALVPRMLLQPLIENAVFHGIEPGVEAGTIEIAIARVGEELRLGLSNPYHPDHHHRQGNRMALDNIRERLQLHFDVEARIATSIAHGRFRIDIVLPLRKSV